MTERRDPDWLARWIAAPDEMLAQKDPIATSLFLAFQQVPMPNLRLNEVEVDAIVDYLGAEDRRLAALDAIHRTPPPLAKGNVATVVSTRVRVRDGLEMLPEMPTMKGEGAKAPGLIGCWLSSAGTMLRPNNDDALLDK